MWGCGIGAPLSLEEEEGVKKKEEGRKKKKNRHKMVSSNIQVITTGRIVK
jgi:hypothetical protein